MNVIESDVSITNKSQPLDLIPTDGQLPVSAVILCGGRSQRMGRSKAFLPFAGKTIIEHQLELALDLFNEVLLVTNEPDSFRHLKVSVVKDILPYRGPIGGILSGLLVATNEYSLVMACDMPLVTKQLLRAMAIQRYQADVVVLSYAGGVEPLLGIYSKKCIQALEEGLFSQQTPNFLDGLQARTFQYPERLFSHTKLPAYFSVDTPQDYSQLLMRT